MKYTDQERVIGEAHRVVLADRAREVMKRKERHIAERGDRCVIAASAKNRRKGFYHRYGTGCLKHAIVTTVKRAREVYGVEMAHRCYERDAVDVRSTETAERDVTIT